MVAVQAVAKQVGVSQKRVMPILALVRGKQVHDKRETLRRRTLDREAEQALKEHR